AALTKGAQVNVLGPGGRFRLRDATTHVFLGDETTLGLFACMAATAEGAVRGAIEVGEGCQAWPSLAGLPLAPALRMDRHGDALLAWLTSEAPRDSGATQFYLAGHAHSIVRLRAELVRQGWSKRSIATKPYWADGKRGL
ncbi:MAG: SIP domain-containing protein, partial [Myxococcota bacterium]